MTGVKDTNHENMSITYNGVTFGDGENIMPPQYRLVGVPVYDEADREIVMMRYSLTVQAVVIDGADTTDSVIQSIKRRLNAAGKKLEITGIGSGFIGEINDREWGPKPRGLQMRPIGGLRAWEIIWTVDFCVVECSSASSGFGVWAAFNFDCSWATDEEGISTRTITGYVQFHQRRRGEVAQFSPDQARDRIRIVVPPYCRRVGFSCREDRAHTRLDFSATDAELPSDAPPPGCTFADGNFNIREAADSQVATGLNGGASLSLAITTAPGFPKSSASGIFLKYLLNYQSRLLKKIQPGGGTPGSVILKTCQISHQLFSRNSSMSAEWMLLGCIRDVMWGGDLWKPVEGDYSRWRASVEHLWGNRGFRNFGNVASDDIIINSCVPTMEKAIGNTTQNRDYGEGERQYKYACPDIPKDASWLLYDCRIEVKRFEYTVTHRKATSYTPATGSRSTSGAGDRIIWLSGSEFSATGDKEHVVEQCGLPKYRAMLMFRGLRLQYAPAMPVIESIGGVPAVKVGVDNVRIAVKGTIGCHTLYEMTGTAVYEFNNYISSVNFPKNQSICENVGKETNY